VSLHYPVIYRELLLAAAQSTFAGISVTLGRFEVSRLAGATRCTEMGEIWCGGLDKLSD